ncbi:hypothetical protein L1887_42355 [Cichorium endivia]|nr:hypothetical protein L1887_42355 [Cichorium endivia]
MSTRIPPYDIPEPTPLTKDEVRQKYARYESLRAQLATSFRGQLAIRGEPVFAKSITIFNDAAPLGGWIVALPIDVHDISTVVKFCNAHRLSPSIKSGGFATAGWSIQGEVVIDTSLMDDVKLVVPHRSSPFSSSQSDDQPILPATSAPLAPASSASAASAAIDPITAKADANAITVRSDSVRAADQLAQNQIHHPHATPIQDQATVRPAPKSETSEDVDPQDPAKSALKRKLPPTHSDVVNHLGPDYASAARRKIESNSHSMQHGRSHESGADADSESSFSANDDADNDHPIPASVPPRAAHTAAAERSVASSRSDFLTASEPRDVAPLLAKAVSASSSGSGSGSASASASASTSASASKIWVDRQLDPSGNASDSPGGSNSGSTGGTSSSQLASSFTSASKQSSAKSSNAGGDQADVKVDTDTVGAITTDDAADETLAFKRPTTIPLPKRDAATAPRRPASRSGSGSGSGSASESGRNRSDLSYSRTPDDWDTSAKADHQRWARHHRPPSGTPGERIKLPEGGFVWRSDGADAGITGVPAAPGSLPWDAEAFAASPEAAAARSSSRSARSSSGEGSSNELEAGRAGASGASYFGASTLNDLQDAWPSGTWAVNQDGANDPASNLPRFIPSPLQKYGSPSPSPTPHMPDANNPFNFDSRPDANHNMATAILPPGMYEDRYALASFGPGVGIRGLDAFTDRAGREGNFLAHMDSKSDGKKRQMDDPDALPPLVVNGVPYHVPVSAYPVGSTAMTTGGFGYLTRAYGLSLDNIVEVEMVLADGRIVTLNEESKHKSQEEQDLWWAVRGAAPCFGIVSRLTAKAYPVPSVYSGNLIYPLNPATAGSLIRHWRDCLKAGLPRKFYTNLILTAGPSKTSHVIVIQVCYLGPKSDGEALVQAISSWTGERLLLKDVEERSFLSQQDGVAKVSVGGPYPCFLGRSERMDRVIGAYGLDNFRRLLDIKKRVDPNNLFRHTFGNGFVVDEPDRLLQDLDVRQTERRRLQEADSQAAAAANGQTSLSQE